MAETENKSVFSPGIARPLIGICARPGVNKDDSDMAMIDSHYARAIELAGGIPVALPFGFEAAAIAHDIVERIDGLLLTGGGDIGDQAFGGHPYARECKAKISFLSADRDVFEWSAILAAWDLDVPALGICRGMQAMNVSFGGTLVRDISERPGHTIAHQQDVAEADKPTHSVQIEHGTQLCQILGGDEFMVNSLHHQAIASVAKGGRISAWAPDGTPEGLEFPEKRFFLGVQWHPELLGTMPQIFTAFVDAARERMRRGQAPTA